MRLKNLVCAVIVIMAAGLYAQYETGGVPTEGMVMYLKYSKAEGTVIDKSDSKFIVGGYCNTTCGDRFRGNSAFSVGNFVITGNDALSALQAIRNITISLWVNIDDLYIDPYNVKKAALITHGYFSDGGQFGWALSIDAKGGICWDVGSKSAVEWTNCIPDLLQHPKNNNDPNIANIWSTTKWVHIVLSLDSTTGEQKVYLNGDIVASRTVPNLALAYSKKALSFGRKFDITDKSGIRGAKACFDDFRIYRRILNEKEVKALYKENGY